MRLGFIGLGIMGQPMARRLLLQGFPLTVWNRSAPAVETLSAEGAEPCTSPRAVISATDATILMLASEDALDAVLDRGRPEFAINVTERLIVNMDTNRPEYSAALGVEITQAGGRYVEAPVSGSRVPAESGQLVCMAAGDASDIERLTPALSAMCSTIFFCGDSPKAIQMKLAVNHYLISSVAALCESFSLARAAGLDTDLFRSILDAGPMASIVSRTKLEKLQSGDWSPQAKISDVVKNADLVFNFSRSASAITPIHDLSHMLFSEAKDAGFADADMVAVVEALRHDRRRDAASRPISEQRV